MTGTFTDYYLLAYATTFHSPLSLARLLLSWMFYSVYLYISLTPPSHFLTGLHHLSAVCIFFVGFSPSILTLCPNLFRILSSPSSKISFYFHTSLIFLFHDNCRAFLMLSISDTSAILSLLFINSDSESYNSWGVAMPSSILNLESKDFSFLFVPNRRIK